MVACDPRDHGCQGGSILYVHMFLKSTGTTTDACAPYISGNGTAAACPTTCQDGSAIQLTKTKSYQLFMDEPSVNVQGFEAAISTKGPIQGQFMVFQDFMYYTSGIYQHEYGDLLGGHGVENCGSGEQNGPPFWIFRNSWGPAWGENGYFRILKGADECTIEMAGAASLF